MIFMAVILNQNEKKGFGTLFHMCDFSVKKVKPCGAVPYFSH